MKYTVKQIAELMGMSEHTIRYYTDLNLLPVKRDSEIAACSTKNRSTGLWA